MAGQDGILEEGKGVKPGEGAPLEEDLPEAPVFMQDNPPATGKKMDMIKWALMHGKSEGEIVEAGFNPKTVRMAAYDLEKEGYRKRTPKSRAKKDSGQKTGGEGTVTTVVPDYTKKALTGPTRGFPPEVLIDQITLPLDGTPAKHFETGMKFGLRVAVLGVRMAQELGSMGMAQVNPIISMANAMRQGEALAARNAAAEAAMLAAEEVKGDLAPLLAGISKPSATGDPMKQMMTRVMEPMLQRMMNMVMPGMGGQTGNLPSGWTRTTREE